MLHAVAFALALVCAGCAFHSEPWPELGPELERDRAARLLDAASDDDAGELEQLDAAAAAVDAGALELLDAAQGDGSVEPELELDAGGAGAAGDAAAAAGSSSSSGMGGGAAGAAAGAGGAGGAGECWVGPWPCVRGSSPDCVCTR